ncbi:MAG: hypothetical protein LBG80_19840 [Bacteroidales bacterium]|nr:hypothetical protein [Bacteroidales bacterium]
MDLFTTYLVTDDLSNEISLLVTGLHFGWFGFIIVNRFFVLTVVILILFTNLKFVNTLEQKNKKVIFSLKDYICKIILSTNDDLTKIGLIQLLFKIKMNKLSFLFFSIRSFTVTMIIIHILVSLNNIFEYGGFSIWGNTKYFIISNIIFLLIIVLFVVVFYMMIKKRFHRLSSNI